MGFLFLIGKDKSHLLHTKLGLIGFDINKGLSEDNLLFVYAYPKHGQPVIPAWLYEMYQWLSLELQK